MPTQLSKHLTRGSIQTDTAGPVGTRWVGSMEATTAGRRQRGTKVQQPGRTPWEAARLEQDLEWHPTANDGALQQGIGKTII